ncbi:MAG: hypothetical protein HXY46_08120 [Syntrophaceae bacterium]|nr:hypothetical protein [Syntrophaceae bacterium]
MQLVLLVLLLFLMEVPSSSLARQTSEGFPVPPPPFKQGMFPCSNCHASMELNIKKRELRDEHTTIRLNHAETMRWCLDCHAPRNRDRLRLYNGQLVEFNRSYLLCGECHGNILGDWKAGIHGKRQGYFMGGKRTYLLCVHCHDSHSPRSKPIKPEPPPYRPGDKENAR